MFEIVYCEGLLKHFVLRLPHRIIHMLLVPSGQQQENERKSDDGVFGILNRM